MGLVTTATFALCAWIAAWSIGVKAIDGMIAVLTIVVVVAGLKIVSAHLPSQSQE